MKTIEYIVHGKVQGVGYRYATLKKARELGVCGYVKNLPNGSVEMRAQGSDEQLTELYKWATIGPRMAQVTKVEIIDLVGENYKDFVIS